MNRPEGHMSLGLLGLKVGMTQIFDANGKMASVTVLSLGPCPVLQIRTPERGHVASEFSSKRRDTMRQAGVQILEKANCEPQRYIREFRLAGPAPADVKVGAILTADQVFKEGQHIDVVGTSKGRGYSGVMKRHNFGGMPAAHGAKKVHR